MNIKSYRDLEVWQKAMDLTMECYKVTKEFPKSETYGMCNQIQRAAVSIPANIAEGRGRQYTKEFRQHLSIAYGSLMELETHILLAERLGYIDVEESKPLMSKTAELGRMINGLQRSLKNRSQGEENKNRPLTPEPRNPNPEKGFSLVELLISMVIATVVGLAGFVIFSTSNWTYKVQEDIAEAQQNVRVAMDRIAKDIRLAGFGLPSPPFSLTISGQTFTTAITVTDSSSNADTITILGIGYEAGELVGTNASGQSYICYKKITDEEKLIGSDNRVDAKRKYVSIGGNTFITLDTTDTDTGECSSVSGSKKLPLDSPSTLDRAYSANTVVYIIQAVQYTINNLSPFLAGCSTNNPCLASLDYTGLRGGSGNDRQPLAESIEDIQFAYGIDSSPKDGKIDYSGTYDVGDFLPDPTDDSSIIAVRATVVARTRNQDPRGATAFKRPEAENHAAGSPDAYRRRAVTKIIKLRNPRT